MIYDMYFNDDHDIELLSADLAFADENNIVKQRLIIRLQFLLAEWFLDNQVGLPYTQFIFQQKSNLKDIYSIFKKEIKDTEGVIDIVNLVLIPDSKSKSLRVDFEVNKGTITDSLEVSI